MRIQIRYDYRTLAWGAAALLALLTGACAPVSAIYTSTEPRIWVVYGRDHVYRCADMAQGEDKAPQPVCIEADRVGKDQ